MKFLLVCDCEMVQCSGMIKVAEPKVDIYFKNKYVNKKNPKKQ